MTTADRLANGLNRNRPLIESNVSKETIKLQPTATSVEYGELSSNDQFDHSKLNQLINQQLPMTASLVKRDAEKMKFVNKKFNEFNGPDFNDQEPLNRKEFRFRSTTESGLDDDHKSTAQFSSRNSPTPTTDRNQLMDNVQNSPDNWHDGIANDTTLPAGLEMPEINVQFVVLLILAVFLSLITMLGNILVMISLVIDRQLRTISNYYLLSLSVADFMIGFISMPLYTLYLLLDKWPLGTLICDTWLALDYLMSNASVLNLLAISVDRYLSVTRPLTYR